MYFEDLLQGVVRAIAAKMREAGMSERRLASIAGISQPHIHNVLKGRRILSPSAADQILRCLDLDLAALGGGPGRSTGGEEPACARAAFLEVPVLDGWLGPSLPLPTVASASERYPFPASFVAGLDRPAVARLAADPKLDGELREHDLVLLDHSPEVRRAPDRRAVYVVNRCGEGLVRRVCVERDDLLVLGAGGRRRADGYEVLPLHGAHILDVIRARVVWIGRFWEVR